MDFGLTFERLENMYARLFRQMLGDVLRSPDGCQPAFYSLHTRVYAPTYFTPYKFFNPVQRIERVTHRNLAAKRSNRGTEKEAKIRLT